MSDYRVFMYDCNCGRSMIYKHKQDEIVRCSKCNTALSLSDELWWSELAVTLDKE
jgi:predicted SprT family Zn-dependent metalloprotease